MGHSQTKIGLSWIPNGMGLVDVVEKGGLSLFPRWLCCGLFVIGFVFGFVKKSTQLLLLFLFRQDP